MVSQDLVMGKLSQIEPGLLQIFRLFILLEWVLFSLSMLSAFKTPDVPDYFTVFCWAHITFLLIYLNWKLVPKIMGAFYLPLALLVASLGPVVSQSLGIWLRMLHGLRGEAAAVDPSRLYLWLILPLILVSVQYGIWTLVAFTVGTSLLPVIVAFIFYSQGGPLVESAVTNAFIRLLFFGIVGFLVVRLTKAQRQIREELSQKNAQLAQYASTLEQLAITRERNRLARELHDTLAHTLSAVNIQLKALEVLMETNPQGAQQVLKQTQELTRTGLQEARSALHDLRTSSIEEMGLLLSLQRLAKVVAERAGLQLKLDLPPQLPYLKPELEQNLYRIAEEALNNVVRHAQASQLTLALYLETATLKLIISDNGVGFDSRLPVQNHYGIVGMQERAALINAQVEIASRPGYGTSVKFCINL